MPRLDIVRLSTELGRTFAGRIINLSPFGVAVECDMAQAEGEQISRVGSKDVRSGRMITRGAVFLFQRPVAMSRFDQDLVV